MRHEPPRAPADLEVSVDLTDGEVDLHEPRVRREVEASLLSLPGVVGARLVPGYERAVDELHVLTTRDRAPKHTVRDVQSVLLARYGITSDHRVISVVALDERDAPTVAPGRVDLARLVVTRDRDDTDVEVHLATPAGEHRGSARTGGATGRHRAVAAATVAALRSLPDAPERLELQGCDVVPLGGQRVALTLVSGVRGGQPLLVCGSALVRDDDASAVARGVLDAVNRLLDAG